jgi:hypothetical protein
MVLEDMCLYIFILDYLAFILFLCRSVIKDFNRFI